MLVLSRKPRKAGNAKPSRRRRKVILKRTVLLKIFVTIAN